MIDQTMVHPELNDEARELRRSIPLRDDPGDLEEPIRVWSEDDVIEGTPCRALVIILKTRGCTWALAGGCTMCGYANESAWSKVSEDQLVAQFQRAWKRYQGEALVKIYTSGSFLDRHEVMPEAQKRILAAVGADERVQKVAFESLPTFIADDTFQPLAGLVPKLEVGIGVESCNERVLRDSVNKGHGFGVFPGAAQVCKEHDVSVKAYLMCKPPFLKECDAVRDSSATIAAAAPHSDVVSLNPTNVQGRTVVDSLYRRGSYRPPWLWTLVQALLDGHAQAEGFQGVLKSDVVAAGQDRGAHNCGSCDDRVIKYLKRFKATQDPKWLRECLERVRCPCRTEWEWTIALGPLVPAYAQF